MNRPKAPPSRWLDQDHLRHSRDEAEESCHPYISFNLSMIHRFVWAVDRVLMLLMEEEDVDEGEKGGKYATSRARLKHTNRGVATP